MNVNNVTEEQLRDLIQSMNEWYAKLGDEAQAIVTDLSSQNYMNILYWLEEHAPEMYGEFDLFQDYLHQALRKRKPEELKQALMSAGFGAEALLSALLKAATRALKSYYYAALLRELDEAALEQTIAMIMKDVYVEERYSSWARRRVYLGREREDETKKMYSIIIALVTLFYKRSSYTLEQLEDYMDEELCFSEAQREAFIRVFLEHKAAMDRYFLFRKLSELSDALTEDGESEDDAI